MDFLRPKVSIRSVTNKLLEAIPEDAVFSTQELRHDVVQELYFKTPRGVRCPFPSTILRYLRYARISGVYNYRCISRGKSLYKKERI